MKPGYIYIIINTYNTTLYDHLIKYEIALSYLLAMTLYVYDIILFRFLNTRS